MPVSAIPSGYTHIHYAFATLTEDFLVDVSADQDAFNDFAAATGFKRILSFGGWSFSTDVDSFPIFRDSVTSANRLTFAQSVVDIVNQHNLDGVDFDWEYPGAPDIPGIPPGSPNDGANYLAFLQTLRNLLPEGKTLSLAAPASYWYLRGFPIADMAQVLDYIVYETYDLHGQWDYANAFSNPGCPTGNCLRSHVNLTETDFALAMITKAGVPTNKITVGVTSYGRSFGMVDPSCTSVDCLFSGPDSSAIPGACTQTAGYLADAEIYQLIGQGAIQSRDDASDSDIVTYQDTWVAYMTPATKASRISSYQAANFAGSVDWAIDLEAGNIGNGNGTGGVGNNATPNNVPVVSLTCTTLAPSATFTLTPACASEIAGLPPRTNNNSPSGPATCDETCDLLREITGTCCGSGGTISNPVAIIPNVPMPLPVPLSGITPQVNPIIVPGVTLKPFQPAPIPIPLPQGYSPSSSITFPQAYYPPGIPLPYPVILPSSYSPPATITIGSTTYPANAPLSSMVVVPAGFVPAGPLPFVAPAFTLNPGDNLPTSAVIPPGFTPVDPFSAPQIAYLPGTIIPPGVFIPPGTEVPDPIGIPAGAPKNCGFYLSSIYTPLHSFSISISVPFTVSFSFSVPFSFITARLE
ncbi:CAZyme family GH18 [Trichoderma harzianum]|nr:CAZyme family GH18 [Trichoderma harzianum]